MLGGLAIIIHTIASLHPEELSVHVTYTMYMYMMVKILILHVILYETSKLRVEL